MQRESYSNYMVRRLREEKSRDEKTETLYDCHKRQAELSEEVFRLNKKVLLLGGDPRQLELDV